MIHSLNRFHAVGHGTFFTGDLKQDANVFLWGFDCGSKRVGVIDPIAKRLASEAPGRPFDLFCISHFDADHVNGLKELLKNRRVRYLALPYLPFDIRLALAARVEEGPVAHEVVQFLLDPVRFIGSIAPDGLVESILLIKGGKGRASDPEGTQDDPFPGPEPLRPSDGEKNRQGREQGWTDANHPAFIGGANAPRVVIRSHSSPIRLSQLLWEFVFFNKSLPNGLTPKSGVQLWQVHKEVHAILKGMPLGPMPALATTTLIADLKKCYDKHFGKFSRARNEISLCLLSRPLGSVVASSCKLFDLPYDAYECACTVIPFAVGERALLLTGDIALRSKVRDRMAKHFGNQRWRDIRVMQIPHHGSRQSWQVGVAAGLPNSVSVFCVPDTDPSGKHPHDAVLTDLEKTMCLMANYSQAVMYAFHIADIATAIAQKQRHRRIMV